MTLLSTQVRAARPVDLPGLAAVLQEAFSDKMRIIFSRQPEKVRTLIEAIYLGPVQRGYDGALVAERAGRIIGTLLIEPMYHTPEENRQFENAAVRELGMLGTLRASFLLWLLGHEAQEGEAYISDVGVAADCQGEGVGHLLMENAAAWAQKHGRQKLTLWVAAPNAPAIHVYEDAGFTITRTRRSWLTRLAFGIREWHFMEKSVEAVAVEREKSDPGW